MKKLTDLGIDAHTPMAEALDTMLTSSGAKARP
jgi:hypothetical protein